VFPVTSAPHSFERQLSLDGTFVSLAGTRAGTASERPTLLLLHGAGMDHRAWSASLAALAAAGASALAPAFPGHGASAGKPLASISDLADWTVRLIDALGLHRPVLAGHSMGALVALEAAARLGARAAGLALIGAAAEMPVNPALLAAAREDPERAAAMIAGWGYGPAAQEDGRAEAGQRMLAASAPGTLAADLQACAEYASAASAAARVRCPVLVIAGEKDKMTSPKRGRALADVIPGAGFIEVPGSGHMLPEEAAEAVARALLGLAQ
jgi:pimeloyl-ACP methyl ester carboxylesterase